MEFKNIKVVILCGGRGSRLGVETKTIPKPMVKIDKDPIIVHILRIYKRYGLTEFILATGYKGEIIKKYFKKNKKFKTKIINTGLNTLTGSRLFRLKKYLNKDKIFMLTYGDGLANVDIKKLYQFHSTHKKTATMTVVRPPVRFGEVKLLQNQVIDFREKPQIKSKWINGGFFVFNRDIFKYLRKKNEMLETNPIERLTKKQKLMAYKHKGFWQCMDTERDKNFLKKLIKNKEAYWM